MNYILVVDDEVDIRDIYEMILHRSFPLDVVSVESGNKAIEMIKKRGKPEIIISDFRMPDGDGFYLYQMLKELKWDIPFVICSTDATNVLKKKFPDIYGYIEKPMIIGPAVEIVDSLIARYENPPQYVPIRISLLLRWGTANFDLYMKLSDSKFIKVLNAEEAFISSDADRFYSKKVDHLQIKTSDADLYLKTFEKNISMVLHSKAASSEIVVLSLETIESVERIAAVLGWSSDVIKAAKHSVNLAVKAVAQEPGILKLLQQKLNNPLSHYSNHVGLLALLTCGFCQHLKWESDSTQMKLGLASLMHDMTVDEDIYKDPYFWSKAASDPSDKTPKTVKYRNHPIDAANLFASMKNVPPDVDQVILQHHEMKEGNGFPRGLNSGRISPMASVFIIVEDLINFIGDSSEIEEQIHHFIKERSSIYDSGNFKKIFEVFKANTEK
jgi:response regulator RpfG family c-di-GMP phosphodiesterase